MDPCVVLVLLDSSVAFVEINERKGTLGLKISVERHGVMDRIEEHPFPRPIRVIVLELSDAHDERHGVMAGSPAQPRIEGKVIATVRCREPIEMVSEVIAVGTGHGSG